MSVPELESIVNRIPRRHPMVESAWYSQGFIGLKLRFGPAKYIKVPDAPDRDMESIINGQVAEYEEGMSIA